MLAGCCIKQQLLAASEHLIVDWLLHQGTRSNADKLSEGDFDGDHVTVIWDETIVKNFVPCTPLKQSEPPIREILVTQTECQNGVLTSLVGAAFRNSRLPKRTEAHNDPILQ